MSKKRPHAFVTDIAGFAGSFLAEELLRSGYRVSGSILEHESTRNIDHVMDPLFSAGHLAEACDVS